MPYLRGTDNNDSSKPSVGDRAMPLPRGFAQRSRYESPFAEDENDKAAMMKIASKRLFGREFKFLWRRPARDKRSIEVVAVSDPS
jgi:hypothetical protein